MKKIILSGLLLFSSRVYFAQDYLFSHFNEAYVEFSDGTLLDNDVISQDYFAVLPIGFEFPYFSYSFDSISSTNSYLYSENSISPNINENISAGIVSFGAPLDFKRGPNFEFESFVSYKVEGNAGNQICKIQWKNLGFSSEFFQPEADYVNFQTWLYENGTIEYRFGGQYLSSDSCYFMEEIGVIAGLTLYDNSLQTGDPMEESVFLVGAAADPIYINNGFLTSLTGHPDSSMVYRFERNNASINELKNKDLIQLFPNPAKDEISFNNTDVESFILTDFLGKKIETNCFSNHINISNLKSGTYFIDFKMANNYIVHQKFVKN